MEPIYLSIQQKETGSRIKSLLRESGYTVRDIQNAMGFENPQAVYKWISGKCLPSLDNFLILSRLLNTSIEDILVIDGDIPRFRIILNYTQRWQESLHRRSVLRRCAETGRCGSSACDGSGAADFCHRLHGCVEKRQSAD